MYYFYWPTQELLRCGYEVEVFCYKLSPGEPAEEIFDGVRVRRFDFLRRLDFPWPQRVSPQLFRALLASDAEVIHAHGYGEFQCEAAFLAARWKRKKLILQPHIHFYPWRRPLRDAYDATLGTWMLNSADRVIVFTEYTRQELITRGINPDRIRVIPHVSRPETVVGNGSLGPQPAAWKGRQIILGCGRLSRLKGWFQALRAFELVRHDFPDALFLLLGIHIGKEPNFFQDFCTEAKKLGVWEHVSVLAGPSVLVRSGEDLENRIRLVRQAYCSATIFTHPSAIESFGVVLLEAMAARLPVVAHNRTGLPCVVAHGQSGFVVDVNDTRAYAGYLSQLLQDSELRRTMGEAGYQLAATKYSQERVAPLLLRVYEEVLGD
jgi:glycosyltransferase involved in cell wall biosynthesis